MIFSKIWKSNLKTVSSWRTSSKEEAIDKYAAIAIIDGTQIPWDEQSDIEAQTIASDLSSQQSTELAQIMVSLGETITSLFRLSMAIRNPAAHDHLVNLTSVTTTAYEQYDHEHVRSKFPHADSVITARLAVAITHRRNYLKYREARHSKLSKNIADIGISSVENSDAESTVATSLAPGIVSDSGLSDGIQSSRVDVSQTSYATSMGGDENLLLPQLPLKSANGQPFQCPLCFTIISVSSERSWKRHVFEDLHPYVCTFPTCETPNRLFKSRHVWFDHEVHTHRSTWSCPEGCDEAFTSQAQLHRHMAWKHEGAPSPDYPNAASNSCRHERSVLTPIACILCGETLHDLLRLRSHVGKHQQQLALFALPLSTFSEEHHDVEERMMMIAESGSSSTSCITTDDMGSNAVSEQTSPMISTVELNEDPEDVLAESINVVDLNEDDQVPEHKSPLEKFINTRFSDDTENTGGRYPKEALQDRQIISTKADYRTFTPKGPRREVTATGERSPADFGDPTKVDKDTNHEPAAAPKVSSLGNQRELNQADHDTPTPIMELRKVVAQQMETEQHKQIIEKIVEQQMTVREPPLSSSVAGSSTTADTLTVDEIPAYGRLMRDLLEADTLNHFQISYTLDWVRSGSNEPVKSASVLR